jgi:hypothetical protein
MASEAVHDLANVLNVIQAGVTYLAQHADLVGECGEVIADLQQAVAAFTDLVQRLRAEVGGEAPGSSGG